MYFNTMTRLQPPHTEQIKSVNGSPTDQKNPIQILVKINPMRKLMIDNLPPGDPNDRTQDNIISDIL